MPQNQTPKQARERSAKIAKALGLIAKGESVRKSCEGAGIPLTTFLENVDGEQYARARDSQADCHFNEMVDLEKDCEEGRLDPQAFRALLDSRKWRLARMRPKVYGDRQEIAHTSPDGSMSPKAVNLAAMTDDQLQAILKGKADASE
jgi:hypothetical protein